MNCMLIHTDFIVTQSANAFWGDTLCVMHASLQRSPALTQSVPQHEAADKALEAVPPEEALALKSVRMSSDITGTSPVLSPEPGHLILLPIPSHPDAYHGQGTTSSPPAPGRVSTPAWDSSACFTYDTASEATGLMHGWLFSTQDTHISAHVSFTADEAF